jgi:hypothetical protein
MTVPLLGGLRPKPHDDSGDSCPPGVTSERCQNYLGSSSNFDSFVQDYFASKPKETSSLTDAATEDLKGASTLTDAAQDLLTWDEYMEASNAYVANMQEQYIDPDNPDNGKTLF